MKLLIIDDEKDLIEILAADLEKQGFTIDCALSGQEGLDLLAKNVYDLLILDLTLPDMDGLQVCQNIRSSGQSLPILILSADNRVEKKIHLLNSGVDDYLTKPFSILEIIARINTLLRRPKNIISPIIKIKDLELDKQKQTIKKSGKEICLTKKEFLILEYLMSYPGIIVSRNELMEHVWNSKANFFSKTIEMHMTNLRKKLTSKKNGALIKTISGRGYRFG